MILENETIAQEGLTELCIDLNGDIVDAKEDETRALATKDFKTLTELRLKEKEIEYNHIEQMTRIETDKQIHDEDIAAEEARQKSENRREKASFILKTVIVTGMIASKVFQWMVYKDEKTGFVDRTPEAKERNSLLDGFNLFNKKH